MACWDTHPRDQMQTPRPPGPEADPPGPKVDPPGNRGRQPPGPEVDTPKDQRQIPPSPARVHARRYGQKWAVCILLKCILVGN